MIDDRRLHLPQVTLCAVTSVNLKATVQALQACLAQADFASCKLFTDAPVLADPAIEIVSIAPIRSSAAYSDFLLNELADHITTSHCLVAQWDGHLLNAGKWRPEFLDYDYIGASWPQFDDGQDVGNGGFSLRSRRLMELCRDPAFKAHHPEDLAIGRTNRAWLESHGMRFATRYLADLFAAERAGTVSDSFGYHGAFNMPRAIGVEAFWQVYLELDDRGTVYHDWVDIAKSVGRGSGGFGRAAHLAADRLRHAFR